MVKIVSKKEAAEMLKNRGNCRFAVYQEDLPDTTQVLIKQYIERNPNPTKADFWEKVRGEK